MACETQIPINDINTINGDTVFFTKYAIDEANADWDLLFRIYDSSGRLMEIKPFTRLNPKEWQIETYKETLQQGKYDYTVCYTLGVIEKMILKGRIKVDSHY